MKNLHAFGIKLTMTKKSQEASLNIACQGLVV